MHTVHCAQCNLNCSYELVCAERRLEIHLQKHLQIYICSQKDVWVNQ